MSEAGIYLLIGSLYSWLRMELIKQRVLKGFREVRPDKQPYLTAAIAAWAVMALFWPVFLIRDLLK